jgi:hypothetical protein
MAGPSEVAMQGQLSTKRRCASPRYVCEKVLEQMHAFDNFFVTKDCDTVEREYAPFPGLPPVGSHDETRQDGKS